MLAVLLALALFAAWSAIGAALLAATGTGLDDLRVALSAPVLGSALYVLTAFVLSDAGVPAERSAVAVAAVLLAGATVVIAVRRPRLPRTALPVVGIAVVGLALVGRPMFEFGFDWLANANGDMAFYVLAATQLLHHGLQSPVDVAALAANRDFATSAQRLHLAGLRPGAQVGLSGLAAITGRPAVQLYMPMLLALNMTCVCASGSLAVQAARRWWAAAIAAAVLAISPMMAYGVLQQLMPQVWGLALAAALVCWLMRPEVHRYPGARLSELVVISILTAALFVVYVELGASLVASYLVYLAVLLIRRQVSGRALVRLWLPPAIATAVIANTFLHRELGYLHRATQFGVSAVKGLPLFGYALVPTALPGAAGFQRIFAAPTARPMQALIVLAALLLLTVIVACVVTLGSGSGAVSVLAGDFLIGVMLARNANDFGLFKLYMYVQPFLAAAAGFWIASVRSRRVTAGCVLLLGALLALQVPTLDAYVNGSRSPIDLRHASEKDLLPRFRQLVRTAKDPIVSVTDNYALGPLEGASAGGRPIYFIGRNIFDLPWAKRTFVISPEPHRRSTLFQENVQASRLLARGTCVISIPGGSQIPLNRRSLPEGGPDLAVMPCSKPKNLLVFVDSSRGQASTVPLDRHAVSFWSLEPDPMFAGRTFSGFGRYALFQIIGATPTVRVELTFSTSSTQRADGTYSLPRAAVVGNGRVAFPVVGSGSARVFSQPLRPRMIDGRPYLLIDMGRAGRFPAVRRPGLTGLWGTSISLDTRALTSYIRDVSLVTPAAYRAVDPPGAIAQFPSDLADPSLEYSGIYEDGWIGRDSYVVLAAGPRGRLRLRADIVPHPDRLEIFVDGRRRWSGSVPAGRLDLRLPLPASHTGRRVELRWASSARLSAADPRPAAAHLAYLGVTTG